MKNISYKLAIISILLLITAGCNKRPDEIKRLQWCTMGTIAAVQSTDLATAQALRDIAQDEFATMEAELSSWNSDSTLAMVNRNAGRDLAVPVSASFTEILKLSTRITRDSGGAFNPLIGPVLKEWGFNGATTPSTIPSTRSLQRALSFADIADVELSTINSSNAVRLTKAGMQLDLGAIAKGYAVDQVWQAANEKKLTNALIDLGGNLRAMGEARPGRGGWLTGVRDPFNDSRIIARILIRDGEAIATSGNYERYVIIEGERCAHIIDGRTAMPIKGVAGVTVVAPDAATADALSTALFVLSIEEGKTLIKEHYPESLALWIPDSQPVQIISTDKMEQRLQR
ncbi:MAG: FAD:protein FMN transferase [Kiritimatiellae bacterium]|jgi:thiamine biosynthesis lipoprotein|nr:FAD:protein FMN transferase [Kiritimatiellia bacterium]